MYILIRTDESKIVTKPFFKKEDARAYLKKDFMELTRLSLEETERLYSQRENDICITEDWACSYGSENHEWLIEEFNGISSLDEYGPGESGTHLVRATFMVSDYAGYITYAVKGNCRGVSLVSADLLKAAFKFIQRNGESSVNGALTLEELRRMDGKPAWCTEKERYGLISVEDGPYWNGIPFFLYTENGCNFNLNIESRGLTLYPHRPIGTVISCPENDCSLTYHLGNDEDCYYSAILKNPKGNKLEFSGTESIFEGITTCIEITGWIPE